MSGSFRVTKACCVAVMVLALPCGLGHAVAAVTKKPHVSPSLPAAAPAPAQKPASGVPLLPGGGSKEPVNINAGKLDYYDKEQKLIYTGDVVVVQGDSTLKASVLTIFLEKNAPAPGAPAAAAEPAAPAAVGPGQGSSVRHMDATGPVTLISKDQVGTGDNATYDKGEDKVYLNGNVTLSQGTNVTQGDRLIYDMATGQAQVFSGQTNGGRVMSVFTPGSGPPGGPPKPAAAPKSASAANGTPNKRKPAPGHAPRGEDAAARGDDIEAQ